jgi:O-antigen/teichoic acid export membrane protein
MDISNRLSNAIIVILISKYLTIDQFGAYNIATSYFTIGSLLCFWGLGNLLIREVAKKPENFGKYFFNFGILRIIFGIGSIIILLVVALFFNYSPLTFYVISIVCIGILAEAIKNICYSAFNAFEKTQYVSVVYLISGIFKIIGSYILLSNNFGIIELAGLNTIVNFLGALTLLLMVNRFLPKIEVKLDWKFNVTQIKLAFPLFLMAIFSLAENRLDVIIMSGFYSESLVGYYTAAVFLESALLIFPEGIRNGIFPVFSRYAHVDPEKAKRIYYLVFKYISFVTIAIAVGGIFLAPQLLSIVYKEDFLESVPAFRLLMVSYPFFSLVILNVRLLNANNQDKKTAQIYALNMLLSLVFHLLIIPRYAGIGAAYVRLGSTILLSIFCFVEVFKLIPSLNIKPVICQSLIASTIMSLVLILIKNWNLFLIILFGALTYLIALIITRAITSEEINLIRSFFSREVTNNET